MKLLISLCVALIVGALSILYTSYGETTEKESTVFSAQIKRAKLINISSKQISLVQDSVEENEENAEVVSIIDGFQLPAPFIDPVLLKKLEHYLTEPVLRKRQFSGNDDSVIQSASTSSCGEQSICAIFLYNQPSNLSNVADPSSLKGTGRFTESVASNESLICQNESNSKDRNHWIDIDAEYYGVSVVDDSMWLIDAYLVSLPTHDRGLIDLLKTRPPSLSKDTSNSSKRLIAIMSADLQKSRSMKRHEEDQLLYGPLNVSSPSISNIASEMGLKSYKTFSTNSTWTIGVIDTGVKTGHDAFENCPINLSKICDDWRDNCGRDNRADSGNHGTPIASILNSCGAGLKGITNIPINSYRFPSGNTHDEDKWLFLQALQNSVHNSDKVINVSQYFDADVSTPPEYGSQSISMAIEAAFDCGSIVVAASGNTDTIRTSNHCPDETEYLGYPAQSRSAIAVGADYEKCTETRTSDYLYGDTPDDQKKPELISYTCALAARSIPGGHHLDAKANFPSTSGATPFITGAAALLRSWLVRYVEPNPEPGLIHAFLILSGQLDLERGNCSSRGAGLVRLPQTGILKWGEVELEEDAYLEIDFSGVDHETHERIDVGVWWPGEATYINSPKFIESNIIVDIKNSRDRVVTSSELVKSVYQRAGAAISSQDFGSETTSLKINVRGRSIPFVSQKVYWAAFLKKREGSSKLKSNS